MMSQKDKRKIQERNDIIRLFLPKKCQPLDIILTEEVELVESTDPRKKEEEEEELVTWMMSWTKINTSKKERKLPPKDNTLRKNNLKNHKESLLTSITKTRESKSMLLPLQIPRKNKQKEDKSKQNGSKKRNWLCFKPKRIRKQRNKQPQQKEIRNKKDNSLTKSEWVKIWTQNCSDSMLKNSTKSNNPESPENTEKEESQENQDQKVKEESTENPENQEKVETDNQEKTDNTNQENQDSQGQKEKEENIESQESQDQKAKEEKEEEEKEEITITTTETIKEEINIVVETTERVGMAKTKSHNNPTLS